MDLVKLLLKHSALTERTLGDYQTNALFEACKGNDPEIVDLMLLVACLLWFFLTIQPVEEGGAGLTLTTFENSKWGPLHFAAAFESDRVVKHLVFWSLFLLTH